ncbi:DsbA family protein [Enterovirga sp.]|jgi:protein-disulfide isomerase|uniref:DsbA family protein n=1 Tax=Enterovirga sp. TaxID=2026350 RepID=UPI002614326C|nr:DsbA family protein [Enterovirga sp.]MDB5593001.1 disulfide bond formation protein DsbA [Enterovirga sp.]
MIPRRSALLALTAALTLRQAHGQSAANQWFPLQGDEGHPVPNGRAPIELVEEIEDLRGAIWSGPPTAAVKLVEFYDYNCPWCRAASAARDGLRSTESDLRIGLVNNPILSPRSADAARVDLAVLKLAGAGASYRLHRRLFERPGPIGRDQALEAAAALGFDRAAVETLSGSAEIQATLQQQMSLAASLGIAATPSYVIGGATVLGYPGPKTLAGIVASARRCGLISC